MPGAWRTFYENWRDVTRERLDPARLELMPELARFAPPAGVFDKAVYSALADGRLDADLKGVGSRRLSSREPRRTCACWRR